MGERKLINASIWIAKDQLKRNPNQVRFHAELGLFKRLTGYKDTKNDDLKEGLRSLRRTEFEYNILNKDMESWGNFSYFSDVEIQSHGRGRNTYIFWEYPSRVLDVIKDPKIYVRLNLLIILGLDSKHSVVLYEYLLDYIRLGKYTFYPKGFRTAMGIVEGQYSSFSMLKIRVVDVAVKEINEKTDLDVSYEVERIGRRVHSIHFTMHPKKHRLDLFPDSEEIRKKLQIFGIKEKKIETLLKKHDQQYLRANIEVVEQEAKKGKIRNLAAYLLKAFENDYRPIETQFFKKEKLKKAEQQVEDAQAEAEAVQEKAAREQFEQWKKEKVLARVAKLPEAEYNDLKTAFLQNIESNKLFTKMLETKGFEDKVIQIGRCKYLAPILLSVEECSFENFQNGLK